MGGQKSGYFLLSLALANACVPLIPFCEEYQILLVEFQERKFGCLSLTCGMVTCDGNFQMNYGTD